MQLQVRHAIFNVALLFISIGATGAILGARGIIPNSSATIIAALVGAGILIIQSLSPLLSTSYTPDPPNKLMRRIYVSNSLLALIMILLALLFSPPSPPTPTQCNLDGGSTLPISPPVKGIGIIRALDGECIGISDGSFASDSNGSYTFWKDAGTSNAERLIYEENNRIQNNHSKDQSHIITIVVATTLSGDNESIVGGHSELQGAYVAQEETNKSCLLVPKQQCLRVRLLIANLGGEATYAETVANQIVQEALHDTTFAGVMGFPFSTPSAIKGIKILDMNHILVISPTASSDALTSISTYFLRVAPPDSQQGAVGAQYVEQILRAKTVALFYDPSVPYSQTLASSFYEEFSKNNNNTIFLESYTGGEAGTLDSGLQDALQHNPAPDLIYFAGYSRNACSLLSSLRPGHSNLEVMGGDALYGLGGFSGTECSLEPPYFDHLRFTAFAYPDKLAPARIGNRNSTVVEPSFVDRYGHDFDPSGTHKGVYHWSRPDSDAILSYDATLALLSGTAEVLNENKAQTLDNVKDILRNSQNLRPFQFQGISGQVTFAPDGNPVHKSILVVCAAVSTSTNSSPSGPTFHLAEISGQFLQGETVQTQGKLSEECR